LRKSYWITLAREAEVNIFVKFPLFEDITASVL
jgi:hypothetical protein